MVDFAKAWDEKARIASKLENRLDPQEVEVARRDPHARRLPRPCGLTVHTGLGCKFGCLYCYIYDMGLPRSPRAYPLTGLQLAYALAVNPSLALGIGGTWLAFGSVTEPFMEETAGRALEYMRVVARELGNPIQFSTKAYLDEQLAQRLSSIPDRLSALVTIVTTSLHGVLEPGAPPPEARFQTIRNLSKRGIHTCLFFRPILPGIGEREVEEIFTKALDSGASGVVLGSMRVTEGILKRLNAAGYPHISEILGRVSGNLKPGVQVTLRMSDLKKLAARLAEELGLRVYPSACAANVDAHGLGCMACRLGPCGETSTMPDVDESSLRELSVRYGLALERVSVSESEVFIVARGSRDKVSQFREFVKSLCKRRVVIR